MPQLDLGIFYTLITFFFIFFFSFYAYFYVYLFTPLLAFRKLRKKIKRRFRTGYYRFFFSYESNYSYGIYKKYSGFLVKKNYIIYKYQNYYFFAKSVKNLKESLVLAHKMQENFFHLLVYRNLRLFFSLIKSNKVNMFNTFNFFNSFLRLLGNIKNVDLKENFISVNKNVESNSRIYFNLLNSISLENNTKISLQEMQLNLYKIRFFSEIYEKSKDILVKHNVLMLNNHFYFINSNYSLLDSNNVNTKELLQKNVINNFKYYTEL